MHSRAWSACANMYEKCMYKRAFEARKNDDRKMHGLENDTRAFGCPTSSLLAKPQLSLLYSKTPIRLLLGMRTYATMRDENQIYATTTSSAIVSFADAQTSIWHWELAVPVNCVLAVKFQTSVVQSSRVFTLVQPSSRAARPIPATQEPTSPGRLPTSCTGTFLEDAVSMLVTISRTLCPVPVPRL
jgi:hypothetical protein